MNEQLKKLVAANGMAAVLASLKFLVNEEVSELEELETEEDAATAQQLEEVGSLILEAANKYDQAGVAV